MTIRYKRAGALGGAALLLAAGAILVWAWAVELPAGALSPGNIVSVQVTDRGGNLLREVLVREDGRATWAPLDQISPHLVQATLAGEDQRFYQHSGVDYIAMGRALLQAAQEVEVVSGASTITMQLARLLATLPRSLPGKLRQAALAYKLEGRLSKEEILSHYLNRAPYGNGTFGVEAAARRYFNRPARRLSLCQATLLAALPRAPSAYNPFRHRTRLERRQRYLLSLMEEQGRITAAQRRMALGERVDWEAARKPFSAPHAVSKALALARKHHGNEVAGVTTTLDLKLQQWVSAAVTGAVTRLADQGVSNASVLVVDNESGDVLAHVGSAHFFDKGSSGQVDGATALRQPGSTMKPFTYAMGLEMGKTPASILKDLPARFSTDEGEYHPRNYDKTFHGPVRLRVALASSYNVPAVRMARFVGVERLLDRLHKVGFSSLTRPARHYGLGLTLGNGEVTLYELVAAYAALARGGSYQPLRLVKAAVSADGAPLSLPPRPGPRRVFSRQVSYLVSHILSDPMARLPAFGRDSPLHLDSPAAVKTGTSKDFRDNWTVGYTRRHTVAVWVGNFDGASMHNVSGVSGAGPLWAEVMTHVMRAALGERPAISQRPAGLTGHRICALSGGLAGPHCPGGHEELFRSETPRPERCRYHQELRLDRENGMLAGLGCPESEVERSMYTIYPPAYLTWAAKQGLPAAPERHSPRCPVAGAAPGSAEVAVRAPAQGDQYYIDPDLGRGFQTIPLEAVVKGPVREVRWLVDGREVARAEAPFTARWPIRRGRHTVQALLPSGQRSGLVSIAVD